MNSKLPLMIHFFFLNNRKDHLEADLFYLMYYDKKSYEEILEMPTDIRKEYISFISDILNKDKSANT